MRPTMFLSSLLALVLGVALFAATPSPTAHAQSCHFQLGFATLQDLIPDIVGDCVTDEFHNGQTGDGLQITTNGLLVWRKADNWTAFTDGYHTWVKGPFGLQMRLNTERFPWEASEARSIQVFFSRDPESFDDFTAVFPVGRLVMPVGGAIATAALEELIDGPTPDEQAQGLFTELDEMLRGSSNCDGKDFEINIAGGTATVQFCRQVISAGIGQDARVVAQIDATLGQFDTIDDVRLLNREGSCLFDPSGMNLC